MSRANEFLDHSGSDVSDAESGSGYDSEAAEVSRTERRGVKRRKLSHSSDSASSEDEGVSLSRKPDDIKASKPPKSQHTEIARDAISREEDAQDDNEEAEGATEQEIDYTVKSASTALQLPVKSSKKKQTPGVIYLSSVPPYLKPSALRNLLAQRGFEPVTRLFLAPSSKHKHSSKKNSRQLYAEGWIEFASKKTAKHCAEALNAQLVGGKKGGFYHDDLWNMKYLRGMSWEELMSGVREEKREEEGRRDEERRRVAKETEAFVRGVEKSKQLEGMKRKRQKKDSSADGAGGETRMDWKQHELAKSKKRGKKDDFDPAVKQVLAKIF